jgi:hypothetical protein
LNFDRISKITTDRSDVHGTCYGTIFLIDVDVRIPEVKNKLEEAGFRAGIREIQELPGTKMLKKPEHRQRS